MAPKHHYPPISGGDRKALTKEAARWRADVSAPLPELWGNPKATPIAAPLAPWLEPKSSEVTQAHHKYVRAVDAISVLH
jgi:hypothetical protein